MRISHRYRFVFLAYPRTASSSIRTMLDPYSDVSGVHLRKTSADFPFHHHMTARELKAVFDRKSWHWAAYDRFCLVRSPFTRLPSLFLRRTEPGRLADPQANPLSNRVSWLLSKIPTRTAFLLYVATRSTSKGVAMDLPAFTQTSRGEPLLSRVIRFENLAEELPEFLASIGIASPKDGIPFLNAATSTPNYRDLYSPATLRLVYRRYQRTIDRFGYSPPAGL